MDEAEIAKQKYISVLVGSLDAPNQTFLVDCHLLDSGSNVNSSIILHTVDDILRQLEIKRENFSLFLTDAARWTSLAGKTLKELYPSLMHVTCVAHLLHSCAMRVRAHFKNTDEIIATSRQQQSKTKIARKIFLMLVCHLLLTLQLQDGQLGLELPYITVRTFQLFVPLSTIG